MPLHGLIVGVYLDHTIAETAGDREMNLTNDIKAAQKALEEARNRPVNSFFTAEESFFNDAPATREEAKAEFVAKHERLLQSAFAVAADQKEQDAYIAQYGHESTVI